MEDPIQVWLLLVTLFLPRLGLVIAWCSGQIPFNTIPFFGDVLLTILLPRLLMLIYIATNLGFGWWFFVHCVAWAIAIFITLIRRANSD